MAECFNRQMLRDLLTAWGSGQKTDAEMATAATELWNKYGVWIDAPESDPRSITKTVLQAMLLLGPEPLAKADVPAAMEFLGTAIGAETEGWLRWRASRVGAPQAKAE